MKSLSWFFILFLFLSPAALCQLLPFQIYTTRDGLISNSATALLQDSKGYIWIGSYNGFSIFNGFEFKNYSPSEGFPSGHVGGFAESKHLPGTMWISTVGSGVVQFTNGKFQQFKLGTDERHNQVGPVIEDRRGVLWCATNGGVIQLKDGRPTLFAATDSIGVVMQLAEIGDSLLWIASRDRGVFCYSLTDSGHTQVDISHVSKALHHRTFLIAKDAHDNLWITDHEQKLLKLSGTRIVQTVTLPSPTLGFQAFLPDRQGNLWLGTVKGLYKVVPDLIETRIVQYGLENGLPENLVLPGLVDAEGNLWIESFSKGLVKLTDESTVSFKLTASPYVMNNSSVRVDRSRRFWVSTPEGLWEIWKTTQGGWRSHIHPTPDEAKYGFYNALFIDNEGYLWAKFWKGQLNRYRIHTRPNRASRLTLVSQFEPGTHYPKGLYTCFTVDSLGRAWFGVEDHGVAILDPQRSQPLVRFLRQEDGLTDLRIRAMAETPDGAIVLGGTTGGLFIVPRSLQRSDSIRQYTTKEGLPTNPVNALWQDKNGTLWIATRRGRISTINNGVINPLPESQVVRNTAIWGFGDRKNDALWIGTQKGLVMLDKRTFSITTPHSKLMGSPVYSCGETENGLVWFISDEGFNIFDPALVNTATVSPPVHITNFTVSGNDIEQHSGMEFPAGENNCVVEFIGISYRAERDISYQHKLEPADATWSAPTRNRSVSFAALQPGSYRFFVRAVTGEGYLSTSAATLDFTILPPWWQSWWFILLAGSSVIVIATALFRYRVRRLLELERLRTRIATDLHDDIGSTLSGISVLSETVRRSVSKSAPKAAKQLDRIGISARTMLEAMDDIVWAINPDNDSLDNFTSRLREYAAEVFEARKIKFDVHLLEHSALTLPMENRRNLYLILKEAMNNAVRHSKCRHAKLNMHEARGILTFTVSDNGTGFDPSRESSGNGLTNMRKRAKTIGALLEVESYKRNGTTISVSLKIT